MSEQERTAAREAAKDMAKDLLALVKEWKRLGIDPDDFIRCAACHLILKSCAFPQDPPEAVCKCEVKS